MMAMSLKLIYLSIVDFLFLYDSRITVENINGEGGGINYEIRK